MSKFSSAAVATTLWQFDTWVNHHPRRKEMFTIWCHWYKNSKVLHTEKKAIHFGSDSPTHTWHERYITSYNTCLLCTLVAQLTAGSFLKHILTCSYWYTYGVEPPPPAVSAHMSSHVCPREALLVWPGTPTCGHHTDHLSTLLAYQMDLSSRVSQ